MKKTFIIVLSLVFLFVFFLGFKDLIKRDNEKPTPSEPRKPKILAFYEEGRGGVYSGSLTRLKKVVNEIDVVSPVWLGLRAEGEVNWNKTNAEALNFFTQNKLDWIVLATAGSGQNGSSIISSEKYRLNACNSIADYLKKVNANGVCLDFEYLNHTLKEEFLQFVKELKTVLAGKKLLVAVFPYIDWPEPTKEVYDYHRLGEICDGVIIMTYDEHRPQDKPGSISSREWVNSNLKYFLAQIDAEKLWLGIAGYGYQWQTGKNQAVALPAWYCREKALRKGFQDTYHAAGNDYLQFTEKDGAYTIWWEGARGMKEKLGLAAECHLAGVALWRLGYEEEKFWECVKEFK